MNQETPTKPRQPLIPNTWGPIISAVVTAVVSFLIWMANTQRQVDARLDSLETKMNHITDREGELRPSPEASRALFSVDVLKEDVHQLRERQSDYETYIRNQRLTSK